MDGFVWDPWDPASPAVPVESWGVIQGSLEHTEARLASSRQRHLAGGAGNGRELEGWYLRFGDGARDVDHV